MAIDVTSNVTSFILSLSKSHTHIQVFCGLAAYKKHLGKVMIRQPTRGCKQFSSRSVSHMSISHCQSPQGPYTTLRIIHW
jgi:hypothetical protein